MEWKYKKIFLLVLLCLVLFPKMNAQNCLTFRYDDSGNRMEMLVGNCGFEYKEQVRDAMVEMSIDNMNEDFRRIDIEILKDFMEGENRYLVLKKAFPAIAEELFAKAEKVCYNYSINKPLFYKHTRRERPDAWIVRFYCSIFFTIFQRFFAYIS